MENNFCNFFIKKDIINFQLSKPKMQFYPVSTATSAYSYSQLDSGSKTKESSFYREESPSFFLTGGIPKISHMAGG